MTEFRQLPQNLSGKQDDELLLVTPTTATRATLKSLFWDNYALLKFRHPAESIYGIGQADTWATLPFNHLNQSGADPWVSLNPNGSFFLYPGLYQLSATVNLLSCDRQRLAVFRNGAISEVVSEFASFSSVSGVGLSVVDRFSLTEQSTVSIAVATAQTRTNALHTGDVFLSGSQVTIATCEIFKLG